MFPITRQAKWALFAGPRAGGMILAMSTLTEIETAARRLAPAERQQLLIFVAQILREEGQSLPEPRTFSAAEMQAWMDEDEMDLKKLNGQP